MRVLQAAERDRERFDHAVAASPLADVLQSWEWGEVKRATGWVPQRLIVEDEDGTIRAACSVLRLEPVRGVPPLLYAPRGPVLDYGDDRALRALLAFIAAHGEGAFMFKCDPPVVAGGEAARALARAGLRGVHAGAFGGTQPTTVMLLDLSVGADKVFEGFKPKWRYNVRVAERRGVRVRDAGRSDLDAFHVLYRETAARDGFVPRGRSYFETLFDRLEPHGMLRMFLAELEGEPVAAIILMSMGERAIYVYGASSGRRRDAMPNHILQWTAIKWAAEAGYSLYDFRGVSPVRDGEPVIPHLAGLNRFKEGFGARTVEYAGEFDLVLRPLWYQAWLRGAPAAMRALTKLRGRSADAGD
ncbi:MAG TPA: peptidoglycan bridge formation glycyltransferase FemA/FemB family protein [Actinomycetota bacterium]